MAPFPGTTSKQAIKVLIETESRKEGVLLLEHKVLAIAPYYSGFISVEDPRFLKEDIFTLIRHGWIRRFSDNNYRVTRNEVKASKLLKETNAI